MDDLYTIQRELGVTKNLSTSEIVKLIDNLAIIEDKIDSVISLLQEDLTTQDTCNISDTLKEISGGYQ